MTESVSLPVADQQVVDAICAGELRAAARLISRIERGEAGLAPTLAALLQASNHAPVIGITGPPGAGKSTLLDKLLAEYRQRGERIAVLAIDPSSPLSQGAILGDRVRMNRHNADPGIFIRSMASRGRLGGLADATRESLTVFRAMGFDKILVETVGVGQNEVDIVQFADSVVVMVTPLSGDMLQAVKAGILEVADIFAINKADTPGADRMVSALRQINEELFAPITKPLWLPPIQKLQANADIGTTELIELIDQHIAHLHRHPEIQQQRQYQQTRIQLLELVNSRIRLQLERQDLLSSRVEQAVNDILSMQSDLSQAADTLIEQWKTLSE